MGGRAGQGSDWERDWDLFGREGREKGRKF